MNIKDNKKIAMMVSMILFSILLAGCSTADAGTKSAEKAADNSKPSKENALATKEAGFPAEKTNLNIVAVKSPFTTKGDYNEMQIYKNLEQLTNIHVNWTLNDDTTWTEKKNLLFASGTLPDALYGSHALTDEEIVQYGAQGLLIPLQDLIDKHAPNIKKIFEKRPEYKSAITAPDGNIYALPSINERESIRNPGVIFINKGFLDQLKLPPPKTTEQFHQALKAFKDNQLTDIPLTFVHYDSVNGMEPFSGAFGVLNNADNLSFVKDGKVHFAPMEEGYRDFLTWVAQLYKGGLIDPESFTQDVRVFNSKIKDKEAGAAIYWSNSTLFGNDASPYQRLLPLTGPSGEKPLWNVNDVRLYAKGAFAITNANKNPALTMKWIDVHYSDKWSVQMLEGPFGITQEETPNGKYESIPEPRGMGRDQFRHMETAGNESVHAVLTESYDKMNTKTEKYDLTQEYLPYHPKEYLKNYLYTQDEVRRLQNIHTDIKDYVKQTTAALIIKGVTDDAWNSFVSQLKKLKVDNMIGIYQTGYDRFKK